MIQFTGAGIARQNSKRIIPRVLLIPCIQLTMEIATPDIFISVTNNFFISTDKSRLDLGLIKDFLNTESYWAVGRSVERIERSIRNSLCFGVFTDQNEQVGFARVVSDFAVFAWIMDLFILEEYRGKGLSKLLMTEIMAHPDLQGLQRWGLGTNDAHGLYEKFGFRKISKPEIMMEIVNKPG